MSARVGGLNFGCKSPHPLSQGSWETELFFQREIYSKYLNRKEVVLVFVLCFFEMGSHYVVLPNLTLAVLTRLASNS